MRAAQVNKFGPALEVVRCVESEDVGEPGPSEVVFDVLAFPINPSDLMFINGDYGSGATLPLVPGSDCAGRVVAVGEQVTHVTKDDLVITLTTGTWTQRGKAESDAVIKMPEGIDLHQAAMMRVNPATALLMLTDIVPLERGDWVVQNAANSALGRILIELAHDRGIRTVNIVRSEGPVAELEALGADVVVVDGPGLAKRIRQATGGAPVKLALDAIGGQAAKRLGYVVSEGGTVCNYGRLSGPEVVAMSSDLILRGVRYVGFFLTNALRDRPLHEVTELYGVLADQVRAGKLQAPVEATYPLEDIETAIRHAQQERRRGKVLVTPNGPL
jgi:trans-2-enoyl-CoA reductase